MWLSKNNTEIYSTYKRTLQAYSDYTINRSLITRRESYLKMVNSHYERGFNDGGFRISQYICTKSEYTTGCAAMIISREYRRRGETARRFGADRQWDLILPSNAHPDNMILSTREERASTRRQAPSHHSALGRSILVSAAHRPAARSPYNVVTRELPEDKRRMPLSVTRRSWYVPACVALSDNYIFVIPVGTKTLDRQDQRGWKRVRRGGGGRIAILRAC